MKRFIAMLLSLILVLCLCSCGDSKEDKYDSAIANLKAGKYDKAIAAFEELNGYQESDKYIMYAKCLKAGDSGDYGNAVKNLKTLGDFKEANMYIRYYTALSCEVQGKYSQAIEVYTDILLFRDAQTRCNECTYQLALIYDGYGSDYAQKAHDTFLALNGYKDSAKRAKDYEDRYANAVKKRDKGQYDAAIADFTALGNYSDSKTQITETKYQYAVSLMNAGKYEDAIAGFKALNGYSDSDTQLTEAKYRYAVSLMNAGKYEDAITGFRALNGYSDSETQITECCYRKAGQLVAQGDYSRAVAIYTTIRDYKDVDDLLKNDSNLKWQPGNTVNFGVYPQTSSGNDKTPIEWIVLDVQGDEVLLISKYALDAVSYNEEYVNVTWETCTLRSWLNNEFYNKAFGAEEKQKIVKSKVTADKNPEYGTNPGNDTTDNVFLLSITEANKYFKSDDARVCVATDYAKANGASTITKEDVEDYQEWYEYPLTEGACWWWLRSPGYRGNGAALVYVDGSVHYYGNFVSYSNCCVRPCVWVRLF